MNSGGTLADVGARDTALRVGFDVRHYTTARNTCAPADGVVYTHLHGVLPRAGHDFTTVRGALLAGTYLTPRPAGVDLVHTWNRVNVGPGTWGVSFESSLPRGHLPERVRLALLDRLLSPRCRFVVGISHYAVERFRRSLPDRHRELVDPKVFRVLPYQPPVASARPVEPPADQDPLRLLFVGRAFFRKGGESLLRAVELAGDALNLHLTLVSPVAGSDYASPRYPREHIAAVRARLEANARITWLHAVPNDDVYRLAARCHIGMLPTLADTFGYSVLEFMASGRPVLTTDVEALPEAVDDSVGWMVALPRQDDRRWVGLAGDRRDLADRYDDATNVVTRGIIAALIDARARPDQVHRRGRAALERTAGRFRVERAAAMRDVYAATVG